MKPTRFLVALLILGILLAGCAQNNTPAPPDKTCAELKGVVCKSGETCDKSTSPAKDGLCCLGTCVPPKPKITDFNLASEIGVASGQVLIVNGVRFVDKIAEIKETLPPAPAEQIYAIVDITFANNTGDTYKLSDKSFQFILSDSGQYAYNVETKGQAQLYKNLFAGGTGKAKEVEILDGLSKRGELAFAINKTAQGLTLHIVPAKSKNKFNVALESAPDVTEFDPANKQIVQVQPLEDILGEEVKVTINGARYVKTVDEKDSDTSFAETEKGKMYAIVSLTAQNISGGEVDLSKVFEVLFKDAQDVSYKKDPKATDALLKPFNSTKITTNDPITGEIAFNIPIVTTGPYVSITFAKGKKLYQVALPPIDQTAMLAAENAQPKCAITIDSVFFSDFDDDDDGYFAKAKQVESTLKNTGKNRFSGTWDLTIKDVNGKVVERIPEFQKTNGRFRINRELRDSFGLLYKFYYNPDANKSSTRNYSIGLDIRDGDKPTIICSASKNVTVQ